jgi:hypothetical protein
VTTPAPVPDGDYDAIVVDARPSASRDGVTLELTILDGEHKGAVVEVSSTDIDDDPVFLLAIPARLVVADGTPTVTLEP